MPEMKEDGKPRRVWLPPGLVIPCFDNGRVIRLRVRRPIPGEGARYVIVSGAASSPLTLGQGMTWIIVESEIDGFLLNQEAGDLAGVVALGNAQARPDRETDLTLKKAGLILVSLDSDQAGAKEARGFWKQTYQNARRWPVPIGKDPTEAVQAGLDLRTWIMSGLMESKTPAQNKATASREGTQATQSMNEGNDKGADRRADLGPLLFDYKNRFEVVGQC